MREVFSHRLSRKHTCAACRQSGPAKLAEPTPYPQVGVRGGILFSHAGWTSVVIIRDGYTKDTILVASVHAPSRASEPSAQTVKATLQALVSFSRVRSFKMPFSGSLMVRPGVAIPQTAVLFLCAHCRVIGGWWASLPHCSVSCFWARVVFCSSLYPQAPGQCLTPTRCSTTDC